MLTAVVLSGPGAAHIRHLGTKSSRSGYHCLHWPIHTYRGNCVLINASELHALISAQLVGVDVTRGSHTQQLTHGVPFSAYPSFLYLLGLICNDCTLFRKHVAIIDDTFF